MTSSIPAGEDLVKVYLGIGSCIDPEYHIQKAVASLITHFGALRLSSVFQSAAVGFEGDDFLNLVAEIHTRLCLPELNALLKQLEDAQGRDRTASRYSPKTLDIDILLYGELQGIYDGVVLPRPEMLSNAYVLWPMAEIAGDMIHPERRVSYQRLWQALPKHQRIRPVPFHWQEDILKQISLPEAVD